MSDSSVSKQQRKTSRGKISRSVLSSRTVGSNVVVVKVEAGDGSNKFRETIVRTAPVSFLLRG